MKIFRYALQIILGLSFAVHAHRIVLIHDPCLEQSSTTDPYGVDPSLLPGLNSPSCREVGPHGDHDVTKEEVVVVL